MKVAAAHAIADLVRDDERSEEYIIPGAFDPVWPMQWHRPWLAPPVKGGWHGCENHRRHSDSGYRRPAVYGSKPDAFPGPWKTLCARLRRVNLGRWRKAR